VIADDVRAFLVSILRAQGSPLYHIVNEALPDPLAFEVAPEGAILLVYDVQPSKQPLRLVGFEVGVDGGDTIFYLDELASSNFFPRTSAEVVVGKEVHEDEASGLCYAQKLVHRGRDIGFVHMEDGVVGIGERKRSIPEA